MALRTIRRFGAPMIAVIALLAGAIFGLTSRQAWGDGEDTYVFIEGEGAQDINGDGMATFAEGMYDVDHDGHFTIIDASALGLTHFIAWDFLNDPLGQGTIGWTPFKICEQKSYDNGVTWTRACSTQRQYDCRETSSGYCTRWRVHQP